MGKRPVIFVADEENDADLLTWLEKQTNRSAAIRAALRAYIRLNNGERQEATVQEAVEAVLPILRETTAAAVVEAVMPVLRETVTAAITEALANYRIPVAAEYNGDEDPELAARLDAQLDEFFREGQ